jgi:Tfp pilus assembly ATPase PilU
MAIPSGAATINVKVLTIEELELPPILKEIVSKRGPASSSARRVRASRPVAAMLDYRNEKTRGHIVTTRTRSSTCTHTGTAS